MVPACISPKPGPKAGAEGVRGLSRQEKGRRAHSRLGRTREWGRNTACSGLTPLTPLCIIQRLWKSRIWGCRCRTPLSHSQPGQGPPNASGTPKSRVQEDVSIPPLPLSLSRQQSRLFLQERAPGWKSCPAPARIPSPCLHEQPWSKAQAPRVPCVLLRDILAKWKAGSGCWDFPWRS